MYKVQRKIKDTRALIEACIPRVRLGFRIKTARARNLPFVRRAK